MTARHPVVLHVLTVGEVADICRVHPQTIRRWIRAGTLPAGRTPTGGLRVPPGSLAALVTNRQLSLNREAVARWLATTR